MDRDVMVGFGGKQAWLAVRDGDPAEVLAALGLRDLGDVSWRQGIDLAHLTDDRVAVTPPLPGADGSTWVLVVGRFLFRPDVAVDVTDLSKQLQTEVQLFATHRVTETHRWQRADDGSLIRAFGYVGQTGDVTSWYGDPDAVELATGLPATFRTDEDESEGEAPLDESMLASLDDELARLLDTGGGLTPDGVASGGDTADGDTPGGVAVGGMAPGGEVPGSEAPRDVPSGAAATSHEPSAATSDDEPSTTVLVSEHDVLRVAEGWSIDPTRLDGRQAPGPLRIGAAA